MGSATRNLSQAPRRGRGRPRAFDRQAVLAAALELFWKHGFHATTTRELEAALGISQSSLYHEFGSKQGLLDAALDRYEADTSRALLAPLEQASDGLAGVAAFFEALAQWVTHGGRRGCMLINMMAEDGTTTPAVKRRTRAYRNRVRHALRASLERAGEQATIASGNADERAGLLLGLVLGFNIAARGGAPTAELRGLLASVRALLASWRA